jgi:solute carrier family 45, member 1/2/4
LGVFGAGPESEAVKTTIMLFAVVFVYVLDFSINVCKFRGPHVFDIED